MNKKLVSIFLVITMLLSLGSISIFAAPGFEFDDEIYSVSEECDNDSGFFSTVKCILKRAVFVAVIGAVGYVAYNAGCVQGKNEGLAKGLLQGLAKGRTELVDNCLSKLKTSELLGLAWNNVKNSVSECTLGEIANATKNGVAYGSNITTKAAKCVASEIVKLSKGIASSARGFNMSEELKNTILELS